MSESPNNAVGRLLADAVPPLREPEDRIGEVAARVRWSRRWSAAASLAAAAAVAALAMAVPQMVTERSSTPAAPEPAACPTTWLKPSFEDAPGLLVRTGAIDATLCGAGDSRYLLRSGVDRLVDVLNSLERVGPDPEIVCLAIPHPDSGASLVLRYPDGGITVVYTDWVCGPASMADGQTRLGNAIETFRELHRAQLAAETDQATIATPRCSEALPPIDQDSGPRDTVERYGVPYTDDTPLPAPLVAARSCRYTPDGNGGGRLVESYEDRGDLTALRDAVNATFDESTLEDSACASAIDTMGSALPDVIVVADATGGSAKVWVFSPDAGAPCPAAFFDPPAMEPKPGLTAYLDRVLGPR